MKNETIGRFVEFMNHIIQRPGMFRVNKVEDIDLVILGYKSALIAENKESLFLFISNFKNFVNNKCDSDSEKEWSRLIRFYSSTDNHSIELFSKYFNEFVSDFPIDSDMFSHE